MKWVVEQFKDGKLEEQQTFDGKGELIMLMVMSYSYAYDIAGKLATRTIYLYGKVTGRIKFTYDYAGRVVERLAYSSPGAGILLEQRIWLYPCGDGQAPTQKVWVYHQMTDEFLRLVNSRLINSF